VHAVQPSQVKDAESTVYVMDAHAPAAFVAVQTFISLPSLQTEPLVHDVVPPPPLLLVLPLPPPLLLPLLPLLPLLLPLPLLPPLPLPPPSAFDPSGFDAPEHAATSATTPMHPKRATLIPRLTAVALESSPPG
jgi:hypothetical protein